MELELRSMRSQSVTLLKRDEWSIVHGLIDKP
jgi:hypothetical protein